MIMTKNKIQITDKYEVVNLSQVIGELPENKIKLEIKTKGINYIRGSVIIDADAFFKGITLLKEYWVDVPGLTVEVISEEIKKEELVDFDNEWQGLSVEFSEDNPCLVFNKHNDPTK